MRQAIAAIDIGGTKVAAELHEVATGRLLEAWQLATAPVGDALAMGQNLRSIAANLAAAAQAAGVQICAIGVGVPEIVAGNGRITSHALIDWSLVPLDTIFAGFGNLVIDADVRLAAEAEAALGAGRDLSSFLYVSIGTGISCALVEGGKARTGHRGGALVLASAPLSLPDDCRGTRAEMIVEEFASGRAIAARFAALHAGAPHSAEAAVRAAGAGDSGAQAILHEAARLLGSVIALALNLTDPEAVVIGGGLGAAPGLYADRLQAEIHSCLWGPLADIPVRRAGLGGRSGVVGAALRARAKVA